MCLIAPSAAPRDARTHAHGDGDVDWLAVAAHELGAPLSSVRLRLETLRLVLADAPPRARQLVADCIGGIDHTAALLDDLVEVGRIKGGAVAVRPRAGDLVAIVAATVTRMRADAERAGCALTLTAPPSLRGRFDAVRVDRVIANLLSNAFKYARGAPVAVLVTRHRGRARVIVRDGGAGIDRDVLPRIFDPFRRGRDARTVKGAGLGLFVAHRLAAAHGGRLAVESARGSGTAFTLDLPLGARRGTRRKPSPRGASGAAAG